MLYSTIKSPEKTILPYSVEILNPKDEGTDEQVEKKSTLWPWILILVGNDKVWISKLFSCL